MARRRGRQPAAPVEWKFNTFPVLFAFALGAFIATLLYPVGQLVFIISLFGTSFGLAHMIGHWFRSRTLNRARQYADEQEQERLPQESATGQPEDGGRPARRRRRRRR